MTREFLGMARKKDRTLHLPKRVLGFKLSKGTRKDLRKLLKLLDTPETRALAISAAGAALGFLAEQTAERKGPFARIVGKAATLARVH